MDTNTDREIGAFLDRDWDSYPPRNVAERLTLRYQKIFNEPIMKLRSELNSSNLDGIFNSEICLLYCSNLVNCLHLTLVSMNLELITEFEVFLNFYIIKIF